MTAKEARPNFGLQAAWPCPPGDPAARLRHRLEAGERRLAHRQNQSAVRQRKIQGAALSNACPQGVKTKLVYLLPRIEVPKGKLAVTYVFGVSSKAADGDNLVKALQDALVDKYGFNDRDIYIAPRPSRI